MTISEAVWGLFRRQDDRMIDRQEHWRKWREAQRQAIQTFKGAKTFPVPAKCSWCGGASSGEKCENCGGPR